MKILWPTLTEPGSVVATSVLFPSVKCSIAQSTFLADLIIEKIRFDTHSRHYKLGTRKREPAKECCGWYSSDTAGYEDDTPIELWWKTSDCPMVQYYPWANTYGKKFCNIGILSRSAEKINERVFRNAFLLNNNWCRAKRQQIREF